RISRDRKAHRRRTPDRALREARRENWCLTPFSGKLVPGTNFREMRAWHRFLGNWCLAPILIGAVVGGRFGAFAEEEFLHLALEELARFRLDRREAVLVDQHRLMHQPALPRELRDVLVDSLAELAGIRRLVEAFGFGPEHYAMDGSCHAVSSPGSGSVSSSARIGAAMPRFDRAAL